MDQKRRYHLMTAALVLGGLYLLFILVYEVYSHRRQEAALEEYARVVSTSLWNFEPSAPSAYLRLVAMEGDFRRLQITTETGEVFVDVHGAEPAGLDAVFSRMGLIPQIEFRSRVYHGEEAIGTLTAVWSCRVIYVCFYALILAILIFEIIWLYERLLAANRGLERRVAERTGELHGANQSLREREMNLAITLDSIGDAVIATDAEGRVTRINPVARALTGWGDANVEGRPIREVFRPLNARTREELPHPVEQVLASGRSVALGEHTLLQSRDRFERLIADTCAPIRDEQERLVGAVLVFRDVTEEYRKDAALREKEERYRSLTDDVLDGSAVGLFILDADFQIVWLNQAMESFFRIRREEVVGLDLREVMERQLPELMADARAFVDRVRASHASGTSIERYECLFPAGEGRAERWLEYQSRPIRSGLYAGGRIEQYYDITTRRRAEEERRAIEGQMQHAQKLESLGVLAGGIAHDFNNLLQGVIGNADLALLDLAPGHAARGSMEEVIRIAVRAAELCHQMLAYSGRGKFMIKAVDLSQLVREMAHLLEMSISKRAKLKYEFAEGLPAIEADVMQVRQVVMNLITNASDAIEKRGERIAIRTGETWRTSEELIRALLADEAPPGRFVYFEVEDDGIGMDEETRARMFDPFYTSKSTGRGLGLAAVSGIVRGHHGAIELWTAPGQGTLMRVLFPAVPTEAENLEPDLPTGEIPPGYGTILMVDDEESVRRSGRQILERAGYKVLTANDGREGVEMFKEHEAEIRAVVLDMTMPVLNGDEVFRALKAHAPGVRVILSSGFSEQEAMETFNGRGPAGFIHKPYRSGELTAMLHRVLGG